MKEVLNWREYFYKEELNVSIPLIKKACKWIFVNVPDLSMLMGWKKITANLIFIFCAVIFIMSGSLSWFDYFFKIAILSGIAAILYIKTIAFMSLKYVEVYQKQAEKVLNRS